MQVLVYDGSDPMHTSLYDPPAGSSIALPGPVMTPRHKPLESSDEYDGFVAGCQWSAVGEQISLQHVSNLTYGPEGPAYPNGSTPNNVDVYSDLSAYRADVCGGVSGEYKGWTSFRIGPFRTYGGFSWTNVLAQIDGSSLPYGTRRDGLHAFSHFTLGNIDAESKMLGYPPIHQHHFHLFGGYANQDQDLNNHGDNQCAADDGGVGCLSRAAPDGYAWMLTDRLGLWTEFNDVRNPYAVELVSYVHCAIKTVDPSNRVQIRLQTITAFGRSPILIARAPRLTMEVSTRQPGVLWHYNADAIPAGATIVEAYAHTHTGVEDMWLFQGTPEVAFDDVDDVQNANKTIWYGEEAVSAVKASLYAANKGAHFACSYRASGKAESICDDTVCINATRKARCAIDPEDGTSFVTVAFFRPTAAQVALSPSMYVHVAFRIYYAVDDGMAVVTKDKNVSVSDQVRSVALHDMDANWLNASGFDRMASPYCLLRVLGRWVPSYDCAVPLNAVEVGGLRKIGGAQL